jgi:hypothetical protein
MFILSANEPIFFGIFLYLIYVLVPLIPAILIYKIFPETKVGTEGLLGQLKINATGAFAAYLIVIVVGYFIIQNIQRLINASSVDNSAWFVKSRVVLTEKNGAGFVNSLRITDDSLRMKLDVKATPDYNQKNLAEVSFPTYYKDGYSKISFTYPGFESQIKALNPDSVKFNFEKRTIDLGTIELKEIKQVYIQNSIPANEPGAFPILPEFTKPKTQ